jgi:hypothetical protein
LVGRCSTELLHPDCFAEVERRETALMEGRVLSIRAHEKYVGFDGREIDVDATVARATCLEGKAFIVSLRHVAARESGRRMTEGHGGPRLEDLVGEFAARHSLAPAQRLIVGAAAESSAHGAICARVDISKNTLKTQIRRILERTRAGSLEELVTPLRAAALRR